MQKKCDYCGNYFDDTLEKCPSCGAPNDHIARSSNEQPETIQQLQQWYQSHNLPPENVTRFFIGKNVKEKRAFGIYKDENTGNFVVYKNKDNGQRAVRYEGKDEKYAVNELYQRLRSEVANQKNLSKNRVTTPTRNNSRAASIFSIIFILIVFLVIFGIVQAFRNDPSGYYNYNGTEYYNYQNDWYYYDDTLNDWMYASDLDSSFTDNYKDYYSGYSYDSDYGANFKDSDYYDSSTYTNDDDWGSDWDNDSSWDSSDSWDSGGSDWSSDW